MRATKSNPILAASLTVLASAFVADIEEADLLITDEKADAEVVEALSHKGLTIESQETSPRGH